jgi:hypothetical protein
MKNQQMVLRRMSVRVAILLFLAAGCQHAPTARKSTDNNPLRNPPGIVDRLVMIDTLETLSQGTRKGVTIVSGPPAELALYEPANREYPRRGMWESDEQVAEFPFTELVPSWNVATPANTGIKFEVRTRDAASKEWSPWLYIGEWGKVLNSEDRLTYFEKGLVHLDNLVLDAPADRCQIRADFQSFDVNLKVNPSLRRVAIAYSGVVTDPKIRADLAEATTKPSTQPILGAVDLAVPFRTQNDTPKALRGQTCSPTSTSMVLAYWGVDRTTEENACAIWDNNFELFGNWGRAVARAGEMGLDAWLERFRNWDQVKAKLAEGTPVIASIRFKRGEFNSSVLKKTAGHLIVIRGMTEDGDIICNDPASRDKGNHVIYKANELARAWFDHGGVGYVIRGKTPAVASSTTAPTTSVAGSK